MICIHCKTKIIKNPIKSDFGVLCSKRCQELYDYFEDTANIYMLYDQREDIDINNKNKGYGNGYTLKPERNMRVWLRLKKSGYHIHGVLTDKGMNVLSHLKPELKRVQNLLETKTEKELRAME